MPTYEYSCTNCGSTHEIVQKMSDPTLTVCPDCGQETLRKLFNNVGVMFKGSGFYRNDSRGSSGSSDSGDSTKTSSSTESTSALAATASAPASTTSTSASSAD